MEDIFTIVTCGACDHAIMITIAQWQNDDTAPCNACGEGADLIHARAHADEF